MKKTTRPLRVFGFCLMRSPSDQIIDPADNGRHDDCRQLSAVVATTTKKEAMEKFGVSTSEANGYMTETGNEQQIAAAMSEPGTVFARPINAWDSKYYKIERKPHVVHPRRVRVTYVYIPRPEFTKEELLAIAERFEMANDPVGQSIAEKALKLANWGKEEDT